MKITKGYLKRLIKEEISKMDEAEGGQTHQDLYERFAAATGQLEDVVIDYADSGWLQQQDQASLAKNLDQVFEQMDKLRNIFDSLKNQASDVPVTERRRR